MADEVRRVLLKVDLDVKRLRFEAVESKQKLDDLVEAQKNLQKGTIAWQENEAAIKIYKKEVADAAKALAINEKITTEQTGSLNEMRKNLIAAKIEYANLTQAERENEEVGGTLRRNIFTLNEEVSRLEEGIGVGGRRVGQYAKEIGKLIGLHPSLIKGLGGATGAQLGLNKAIAANPLGFIIGLFLSFRDTITGFIDKVRPLKDLFEGISAALSFLGDKLSEFTDFIGITSNAIEGRLNKALQAQAAALETVTKKLDNQIAVQQALGNDTLKLEEQKARATVISTQKQIDSLNELANVKGGLNEDEKKQLTELVEANESAVNQIAVIQAKGTKLSADEQKKRTDEAKKEFDKRRQEIIKATQELEDIQLRLTKEGTELEIEQIKLETARKIAAIKGASTEEINVRAAIQTEADARISEIQQKSTQERIKEANESRKRELQVEIGTLELLGKDKLAKQIELLNTERAEAINQAILKNESIEQVNNEFNLRELELQKAHNLEMQKQATDNLFARLEGELLNLQTAGESTIAKQIEIENQRFEVAISNAQLSADERFRIEAEHAANIDTLNKASIVEAQKVTEARIDIALQFAKAATSLGEALALDAEQGAEFQKAFALFQIAADSAKAISGAVAGAQTIPFPGNLLATATAVGTVLSNIARARKLLEGASVPKAAKGIVLGGKPHSSGGTQISADGVPIAEAERGELLAIVNKKSTAMLRGLSNLNQAGGGIPLMKQGGLPEFQSGGLQDISAQVQSKFDTENLILGAIKNIPPPRVIVQDISEAQDRLTNIKDISDL